MQVYESKYQLLGRLVREQDGSLLDVGARDKILARYLSGKTLRYYSSDTTPGHDFQWDLEKPLPASDRAFEVITALDVLEHVENIHLALHELIRVAKLKVYISLPNMSCLWFRLHFLRHGCLSDKYALLPMHQGDRHRWVTTYPQIRRMIGHVAGMHECRVRQFDIVQGYTRLQSLIARLPLPTALKTYTLLFEIRRPAK